MKMEKMNALTLIITLVVGVILTGALLGPVINDATKTTETLTNDGYYRVSETEDETVIVWDTVNSPNIITVNDEEIDLSTLGLSANSSYTIAFADDFLLRYFPLGSSSNIQVWGSNYSGLGIGASSGVTGTFTISSSGITLEKSNSETVQTASHTGSYFRIDLEGDYTLKKSDKTAYVLEDSTIFYAAGISGVGAAGNITSIYFEGTTDEIEYTVMRANVDVSNSNVTYTDDATHVGVVNLDKVTFTTTYETGGETYTIDQTYSYFFVPYQITAELSEHLTPGQISLMGAIPVMVIVALLMAAVGAIALRRAD